MFGKTAEAATKMFEPAEIVKIVPKSIWAEKDFMGTVHIYMQNEGDEPFEFITMNYHHHHTCNSHQAQMTTKILGLLGGDIADPYRPYTTKGDKNEHTDN